MVWLRRFKETVGNIRLDEDSQPEKSVTQFADRFRNNTTMKDAEVNIQLNPLHYPVKKVRPLYLQEAVGKVLEN